MNYFPGVASGHFVYTAALNLVCSSFGWGSLRYGEFV